MRACSSAAPLGAVARLTRQPLVVVDVGARWGVSEIWNDLGDGCVTIGFEPDQSECDRLAQVNRGRSNVRFVPLALGPRKGLSTLFLTKERAASSIYPPAERAINRHPSLEGCHVDATMLMEMVTLDDWCASEGVERVDAMKVDTQGSELGVLEGAVRTLRTVRAVEVEVEFNELYAGAPLFGDVDQFLRSQGFVLWRLRDLAHYAQAGAPDGWRTPDACHYDRYVAAFPAGPGQLYWANAFYLRTEVAYPEAGTGWEQLVRDACLTGVHRFFDLSALALDLARATAPETERAAIEQALSSEAERSRQQTATSATSLSGTLKLSFDDPGFSGGGWQPLRVLDLGGVRWTGPGRDAWVDVPVAVAPGTRVELLAVAAMSPEISRGLGVELNGVPLPLGRWPHRHGELYSGVVPSGYRSPRRFTRVMVRTPAAVPWNQVHPGSPEDSEFGVAVAWLRFTAAEALGSESSDPA